ncbi:MAG TPA: hypothetical protein VJM83_01655, partial [Nitrospirota bacterium]|nr:hypothetical protein [Nitrospirota bacterium]
AAMGALVFYLGGVGVGIGARIAVGALSYVLLMALLKGFNAQDLRYFRELREHYAPSGGRAGRT